MTVYERFGVSRAINATGFSTRLGGALMRPEVVKAMAEAAESSVDITALQAAASRAIAGATGAEAGLVASGATAALQLAAAACIARLDVALMDRLPDTTDVPNEIIMLRSHRTGYDHGLRAAGAVIRDVGHNTKAMDAGGRTVEPWEVEAAIGPQTVAMAVTAIPDTHGDIRMLAKVAAETGIPLIVDAAAQLPPRDNLRRFFDMGATLVAFSGGKALRGPQASGILAGDRRLIMSAALQMLDMDEAFATWRPPSDFIDLELIDGLPQHGVCRALKVGKEEVVGLLTALESFLSPAEDDGVSTAVAVTDVAAAGLRTVTGLDVVRVEDTRWGWPRIELRVNDECRVESAAELSRLLKELPIPMYLNEQELAGGTLVIDPGNLSLADISDLVAAITSLCGQAEPESAGRSGDAVVETGA